MRRRAASCKVAKWPPRARGSNSPTMASQQNFGSHPLSTDTVDFTGRYIAGSVKYPKPDPAPCTYDVCKTFVFLDILPAQKLASPPALLLSLLLLLLLSYPSPLPPANIVCEFSPFLSRPHSESTKEEVPPRKFIAPPLTSTADASGNYCLLLNDPFLYPSYPDCFRRERKKKFHRESSLHLLPNMRRRLFQNSNSNRYNAIEGAS